MNVVRIGIVSRTPVIELEGMGEVARVGEDFDQAPWPTGVTLEQSFSAYLREHVALKPKTPKRIANVLKRASHSSSRLFPPPSSTRRRRAALQPPRLCGSPSPPARG
jgi:hypothetical protein